MMHNANPRLTQENNMADRAPYPNTPQPEAPPVSAFEAQYRDAIKALFAEIAKWGDGIQQNVSAQTRTNEGVEDRIRHACDGVEKARMQYIEAIERDMHLLNMRTLAANDAWERVSGLVKPIVDSGPKGISRESGSAAGKAAALEKALAEQRRRMAYEQE